MRKVLIAIAALGAAASLAGPAAAAPAPHVLHARTLPIKTYRFQRANDTTVAYQLAAAGDTAHGPLTLRTDVGRTWTPAAPDGCRNTAAGSGLLASTCGVDRPDPGGGLVRELAVTRLDGTPLSRLTVLGQVADNKPLGPARSDRAGRGRVAVDRVGQRLLPLPPVERGRQLAHRRGARVLRHRSAGHPGPRPARFAVTAVRAPAPAAVGLGLQLRLRRAPAGVGDAFGLVGAARQAGGAGGGTTSSRRSGRCTAAAGPGRSRCPPASGPARSARAGSAGR